MNTFLKTVCALLMIGVLMPPLAIAQETTDPKAWSEEFLGLIVQRKPDLAITYLLDHSYVGKERRFAVMSMRENLDKMFNAYGSAKDFELVKEAALGKGVLRMYYIVRHKNYPVGWEFYFYRRDHTWDMISFKLIDNIDRLFSLPNAPGKL